MTGEELEKLTRTVIDCWNRSDWAGYRALSGPGFGYEEAGTGRRVADVEAVLVGWDRLKTGFPDATAEIVQVRSEPGVTVVGVIWRATQNGPLCTATGIEPPSYKKVQVWDLITFRWLDGLVVRERHQLGFLSLMAPLLDGGGERGLQPGRRASIQVVDHSRHRGCPGPASDRTLPEPRSSS